MKIVYRILTILLLLFPFLTQAQEVCTLTNVTANGGISVDRAGNIFVAHFGPLPPNPAIGKNIYKISPIGTVSLFVEGELNVGSGNGIDSDGFLYQSNFSTGVIYKIDSTGTIVDPNFASISGPVGIAVGSDNTLFVCGCIDNSVKMIKPDGTKLDFVSGNFFNCTNGITIDEEENLYTTNFNDGRITKISPQGEMQTLGSTPAGNGHIAYNAADQMLYIASYAGHQIFKMDLSGKVMLLAGTGSGGTTNSVDPLQAQFNKPNGIEVSPDGCRLYISQNQNVIREIKLDGPGCTTGIIDPRKSNSIDWYPNPAADKVALLNPGDIAISHLTIYDAQGKTIQQIENLSNNEIDISTLPTGFYSFEIIDKAGNSYLKKMVKR